MTTVCKYEYDGEIDHNKQSKLVKYQRNIIEPKVIYCLNRYYESKGIKFKQGSFKDDMINHIDCYVLNCHNEIIKSLDIKNKGFWQVELRTKTNKPAALYGKQTHFLFCPNPEYSRSWYFVDRKALLDLITDKITDMDPTYEFDVFKSLSFEEKKYKKFMSDKSGTTFIQFDINDLPKNKFKKIDNLFIKYKDELIYN